MGHLLRRVGIRYSLAAPSSEPPLRLPLNQRLKLLRQRALAALNVGQNVDVRLEASAGCVFVSVENVRIAVPSALRWKLYRKGWNARLDRLEREYGIGRHVRLTPDSVVLDVGANVGEFAHVCARHGARVYCFEPDPAAFVCLCKNIAELSGVCAHDLAVWKEDGELDFNLASDRADSSIFADGPRIRRKAITIQSFAGSERLSRIDLVKCDAEGAEPEVLEGIGDAFPMVRTLAVDTGPERKGMRTNDACAAILRERGFTVFDEKIGTRWMTYGVRSEVAP